MTPQTARAQASPSALADPDTEAARRHFQSGAKLYEAADFKGALVEFENARLIKPVPAFDFNIARCHDRLEEWVAAADSYDRYLASLPAGKEADEVRARIVILRARSTGEHIPVTTVAAVPPTATPRPPEAPAPVAAPVAGGVAPEAAPARHRRVMWIVGGTGGALLAGSLVAGLIANSHYGYLRSNCAPDGACNTSTVPDAQSQIDSGHGAAVASDVLLGVGVAAVVVGVALYFVEGRQPAEPRAWRIAPTVGAHGGGLTFEVAQ